MLIGSYIYIPVSDLDRAAKWYEKNLDFKLVYRDALYYDMRTANGIKIMLIPGEKSITSQMKYSTGEQASYGFCVDGYDSVREKLEANGVKIGEEYEYFGRSFSFYDLEGNKIEIWEDYDYTLKQIPGRDL